jgi:hypothetical protein
MTTTRSHGPRYDLVPPPPTKWPAIACTWIAAVGICVLISINW